MDEKQTVEYSERMARVETNIDNLTKLVTGINTKLDTWNQNYVPRPEINEMFLSRDRDIRDLQNDLKERASKEDIASIHKKLDENNQAKWTMQKLWPMWVGIGLTVISITTSIIIAT